MYNCAVCTEYQNVYFQSTYLPSVNVADDIVSITSYEREFHINKKVFNYFDCQLIPEQDDDAVVTEDDNLTTLDLGLTRG